MVFNLLLGSASHTYSHPLPLLKVGLPSILFLSQSYLFIYDNWQSKEYNFPSTTKTHRKVNN